MYETGLQPETKAGPFPAAPTPEIDPMAARWDGIVRTYSPEDVMRLRGSVRIEHTLAQMGARRLWQLLHTEDYVAALGAVTGNQAVQQVRAGLDAIYCSGWQVAADANTHGSTYPDQSLYPVDSVPRLVRRINQALQRADQIEHAEGKGGHEELYVVYSGHARFTIAGEELEAPAGTFVYIADPLAERNAVAKAADTVVLSLGGWAGKAFEPSEWETQSLSPDA